MRATRTVRIVLLSLLLVGDISAIAGSVGIGLFNTGAEYLDRSPFPSLLYPALILFLVVGGTQSAAAFLLWTGNRFALLVAACAGMGMLIWIFTELAVMAEYSWLQGAYFGLGLAELAAVLALLGVAPALVPRESLSRDQSAAAVRPAGPEHQRGR
jgi:hypothetical protein